MNPIRFRTFLISCVKFSVKVPVLVVATFFLLVKSVPVHITVHKRRFHSLCCSNKNCKQFATICTGTIFFVTAKKKTNHFQSCDVCHICHTFFIISSQVGAAG